MRYPLKEITGMDNWIMAIYGHTYYQCIYIYTVYINGLGFVPWIYEP